MLCPQGIAFIDEIESLLHVVKAGGVFRSPDVGVAADGCILLQDVSGGIRGSYRLEEAQRAGVGLCDAAGRGAGVFA